MTLAVSYAVWHLGGVLVPVPSAWGRYEIERAASIVDAGVIVSEKGRTEDDTRELDLDFIDFIEPHARPTRPMEPHLWEIHSTSPAGTDDDVCLVVFTSGSDGKAKGVLHTHRTLIAELETSRDRWGSSRGPVLEPFPAGHIAGVLAMLRATLQTDPVILMDRWDAERALAMIEEHGVIASRGVPTFLRDILQRLRPGRPLSLRSYLCGGAPVPPELIAEAQEFEIKAFRSYGSSEHPTIAAGHPDEPLQMRVATEGPPMPRTQVVVIDDDEQPCPPDTEGEILTRGPEQTVGYLGGDGEATDINHLEIADRRWLRSGDLGRLSPDGRLVVTGRRKELAIRGGENISVPEVEALISSHSLVHEAAVIVGRHDRYGEQLVAVVVTSGSHRPSLDDFAAHFRRLGVDRHKVPEALHVVESFPRSELGKIDKAELRRRFANRQFAPGEWAR